MYVYVGVIINTQVYFCATFHESSSIRSPDHGAGSSNVCTRRGVHRYVILDHITRYNMAPGIDAFCNRDEEGRMK